MIKKKVELCLSQSTRRLFGMQVPAEVVGLDGMVAGDIYSGHSKAAVAHHVFKSAMELACQNNRSIEITFSWTVLDFAEIGESASAGVALFLTRRDGKAITDAELRPIVDDLVAIFTTSADGSSETENLTQITSALEAVSEKSGCDEPETLRDEKRLPTAIVEKLKALSTNGKSVTFDTEDEAFKIELNFTTQSAGPVLNRTIEIEGRVDEMGFGRRRVQIRPASNKTAKLAGNIDVFLDDACYHGFYKPFRRQSDCVFLLREQQRADGGRTAYELVSYKVIKARNLDLFRKN